MSLSKYSDFEILIKAFKIAKKTLETNKIQYDMNIIDECNKYEIVNPNLILILVGRHAGICRRVKENGKDKIICIYTVKKQL